MLINFISRARLILGQLSAGKVALGVLAVMHAVLFLDGYRLTADDVAYHGIVMDGWSSFWNYVLGAAVNQGRIVHFFDVPVTLLAAYFAENLYFRIFYTSVHFLSLWIFSEYVVKVLRLDVGGLLFLLLVAVQPLDYFHLPPNAYPFHVSLPVVLLLCGRLLTRASDALLSGLSRRVFVLLLTLAGMMFGEGAFVFFIALLMFELICGGDLSARWRSGKFFSGLVRTYAWELGAIFVFLAFYLIFRWVFPSSYAGNQLAHDFRWLAIGQTLFGHIWGGTSFSSFGRYWIEMGAFLSEMSGGEWCLVAFVGLVGVYASHRVLVDKLLHGDSHENVATYRIIFAGFLGAVIVTLPVALVSKYQDWCVSAGVCIFHDSRLSYYFASLVVLGLCLIVFCCGVRVFRYRLSVLLVSLVVGGVSVATYVNNLRISMDMRNYVQGWERARSVSCFGGGSGAIGSLFGLIDPRHRIVMHDDFDRDAYWKRYLDSLRSGDSGVSCGGDVYDLLPPINGVRALHGVRDGVAYLGQGWSQPEAWGVWSAEDRVSLFFPVKESRHLVLKLRAFVRPNHLMQRIRVSVDAALQQEIDVVNTSEFEVPIHLPGEAGNGRVAVVEMELPDAISPRALGIGDDSRRLAVGLLEIVGR